MAPAERHSPRGGSCADGATGEIRTPDLLITNQTLYQAKLQWQQAGQSNIRNKQIGGQYPTKYPNRWQDLQNPPSDLIQ